MIYPSSYFSGILGSSKFNIKLLEILLENGCDINLLNNDGHAPINIYLDKNDKAENFSVFLENGANPNLCKENCKSPLIIAIERRGLDDVVDDLLERGANVNYRGPSKVTALHAALEQGWSLFPFSFSVYIPPRSKIGGEGGIVFVLSVILSSSETLTLLITFEQ